LDQNQPPAPRGRSFTEFVGLIAIGASVAAGLCCIGFYLYISRLWQKMDTTGLPSATEIRRVAIRVLDPWNLQPLAELGANPVSSAAADVESLRSQQPLFANAPECDATNLEDLVETAKGEFLVNIESYIKKATALSDEQEMEIGNCLWEASRSHLEKKMKGTILDSGPEVEYIKAVIAPLTARASRAGIRYTVHYCTSTIWNAFALTGGHVVVNKGFLDVAKNEAELAGCLSHEIQHVDRRHCMARLQYALTGGHVVVNKGFLDVAKNEAELAGCLSHEIQHVDRRHCMARLQYALTASRLLRGEDGTEKICATLQNEGVQVIQLAVNVGQTFFTSAQETEADLAGIEIMVRAGYSPFAVTRLWREKAAGNTRGSPETGERRQDGLGDFAVDVLKRMATVAQTVISSHPEARQRYCLSRKASLKYLENDPDRTFYVGTRNLKERVPFSRQQF
jgi:Zn-dependent protease with chaperone function